MRLVARHPPRFWGDGKSGLRATPWPRAANRGRYSFDSAQLTKLHKLSRMNRSRWAEPCRTVPSPLVGEGQGEGWRRSAKQAAGPCADSKPRAAILLISDAKEM